MTQKRILAEVAEERTWQDSRWGGAEHDDRHTPAEWVALLARHLGLAVDDGGETTDPERFRRQMIRLAALAVAAAESFDRLTGREHAVGRDPAERGPEY